MIVEGHGELLFELHYGCEALQLLLLVLAVFELSSELSGLFLVELFVLFPLTFGERLRRDGAGDGAGGGDGYDVVDVFAGVLVGILGGVR